MLTVNPVNIEFWISLLPANPLIKRKVKFNTLVADWDNRHITIGVTISYWVDQTITMPGGLTSTNQVFAGLDSKRFLMNVNPYDYVNVDGSDSDKNSPDAVPQFDWFCSVIQQNQANLFDLITLYIQNYDAKGRFN
jgi:hypothetical protein